MERQMNAREVHNLASRALENLKTRPNASVPHKSRLRNIVNFTRGVHSNSKVVVSMDDWVAIETALPAEETPDESQQPE